jgi:hypothetical protein
MQEKAFVALLSKNKAILEDVIERYDGKVVNGVLITESGILAAAFRWCRISKKIFQT